MRVCACVCICVHSNYYTPLSHKEFTTDGNIAKDKKIKKTDVKVITGEKLCAFSLKVIVQFV